MVKVLICFTDIVGAMRSDIFPEIYRNKFKVLLDSVPALSESESIAIVEKAYGKPVSEVFKEFNRQGFCYSTQHGSEDKHAQP